MTPSTSQRVILLLACAGGGLALGYFTPNLGFALAAFLIAGAWSWFARIRGFWKGKSETHALICRVLLEAQVNERSDAETLRELLAALTIQVQLDLTPGYSRLLRKVTKKGPPPPDRPQ